MNTMSELSKGDTRIRHRVRRVDPGKLVRTVTLSALGLVFVMPYVYAVVMSFTEEIQAFSYPIQWLPSPIDTENYREVLTSRFSFSRAIMNSLFVAALSAAGALLTSSLAGYSFGKLRFPGRDVIFLLYLSTMMIPPQVVLIPRFIMFIQVGLLNTLWALILPATFSIFGTFLLRQFYLQIPMELQEAARIDGAGFVRIWWSVMQPLAKPALVSLLILTFTWKWNEYLNPLVFISSPDKFTIPLALDYFVEENATKITMIMTGAVLSSIPLISLFVVAQKQFIQGVVTSGLKG